MQWFHVIFAKETMTVNCCKLKNDKISWIQLMDKKIRQNCFRGTLVKNSWNYFCTLKLLITIFLFFRPVKSVKKQFYSRIENTNDFVMSMLISRIFCEISWNFHTVVLWCTNSLHDMNVDVDFTKFFAMPSKINL